MKIIRLAAENVKRLVAVEITPEGNVIEITGKNGAGKTSVLDSIWWALAGNRTHQAVPVRRGETEAVISLDLGDIKVRREFSVREPKNGAASGQTVTRLFVESAEGARYRSPQKMLDELVGSLTFDPLAFSRMAPSAKLAVLRGFVGGVDFDAEAVADRGEYQQRRDANRTAKDSRTRAAGIQVPEVKGDEPDLEAHQRALGEARAHNEQRRSRIGAIANSDRALVNSASGVAAIEEQLEKARANLSRLQAIRAELPEPEAERDEQALTDAMREAVQLVGAHRERRGALTRRNDEKTLAERAEAESKRLTDAMATRAARLAKAVADADMPVPGLSLTQDGVLLEGLPLEQASDAEQLRLSCSIAMAQSAKLRVIRVRDGSLLDPDSMAILREMAADRDYQVWIERVDTSGKVGIVIEAGKVAGQ